MGRLGWPSRLGLARDSARPAAQQAGSAGGLAGRAADSARLDPSAGRFHLLPGLGPLSPSPSPLTGLALRLLLLAGRRRCSLLLSDRTGPGVSHGGIRCGGLDPVQQTRVCECVCVAPERCSEKGLNGRVATRTRRRGRIAGVDAHGGAVARAWRSWGQGSGHSSGVRARARVLVFQSRGVAVPCAEHRRSGSAARRGGEG
jgi:hypothetical protein